MTTVTLFFEDEGLEVNHDMVTVNVGLIYTPDYDEAKELAKSMAKDMLKKLGVPDPEYLVVEFEFIQTGEIIFHLDD